MQTTSASTPTTGPSTPYPVHRCRRRRRVSPSIVAAEPPGTYRTSRPHGRRSADTGPGLRDTVRRAGRAIEEVRAAALEATGPGGGELGALLDLLDAIDTAQLAAIELTGVVQRDSVAERSAGMPLDPLLAFQSRLTHGDRRMLARLADLLDAMPHLRAAAHAGLIGFAPLRAIAAEIGTLDRDQRSRLDAAFADHEQLARLEPDRLVDAVQEAAGRLRPDLAEQRELRRVEHRFVHVQPALDGALTLYGELDPESGSTVLAALDAAAAPPTAEHDVTSGALAGASGRREPPDPRTRGRQRADALTVLADAFLAGRHADGAPRRARPRVHVWTDIRVLTGDDATSEAARLLWDTIGAPVALTGPATRRLAADADLQFVVHDDGHILAVSAPTAAIPARLRAAVHARDRGCRFPGCAAPIGWCDLHHVRPREAGGPTSADNLVAVCRRHHTAVTQGRWRLSMDPDGVVTVRRGRRVAVSDPPHRRVLPRGSPRAGP